MKGIIKNVEESKIVVCEPPFTFDINHPERKKKLAYANKIGLGEIIRDNTSKAVENLRKSPKG